MKDKIKININTQNLIVTMVILFIIPVEVWQILLVAAIPAILIVMGLKIKKFIVKHKKEVDEYINFSKETYMICKKAIQWVHQKYIVLSPQIYLRLINK